jgi:hypothetical protein
LHWAIRLASGCRLGQLVAPATQTRQQIRHQRLQRRLACLGHLVGPKPTAGGHLAVLQQQILSCLSRPARRILAEEVGSLCASVGVRSRCGVRSGQALVSASTVPGHPGDGLVTATLGQVLRESG